MKSNRFYMAAVLLSVIAVGCGGGAEPKKMPTVSAEQKAELDKQHAEMKAKTEGGTAAPQK